MHVDLVKRGDQRVHIDDRHACIDHLLDRCPQRVDAEWLDGDEVPFLVRHIFDRSALLGIGKFAIEPGHVDVKQLDPSIRPPACPENSPPADRYWRRRLSAVSRFKACRVGPATYRLDFNSPTEWPSAEQGDLDDRHPCKSTRHGASYGRPSPAPLCWAFSTSRRPRRAAETDCTCRIRPSLPRASRPRTGR
jgi:hypothetical protein